MLCMTWQKEGACSCCADALRVARGRPTHITVLPELPFAPVLIQLVQTTEKHVDNLVLISGIARIICRWQRSKLSSGTLLF